MNHYFLTKYNIELLAESLPARVRAQLLSGNAHVLAVDHEDNNIAGFTVFSGIGTDSVEILYMFVREKYRENGIGCGMLSLLESKLQSAGVKNIFFCPFGTSEGMDEVADFMASEGYASVPDNPYVFEYNFDSFTNHDNIRLIKQKKTVSGQTLSEAELSHMLMYNPAISDNIKRVLKNKADLKLSRFLTKKDLILSCVAGWTDDDNNLDISEVYCDTREGNPITILMLLTEILADAEAQTPKPDRLYLYCDGISTYNSFEATFTEPEAVHKMTIMKKSFA